VCVGHYHGSQAIETEGQGQNAVSLIEDILVVYIENQLVLFWSALLMLRMCDK